MFKFKLNIALVHSISFVCMVRQKQFGDDYQEFRVLRRIKLFAYLEITCEHTLTSIVYARAKSLFIARNQTLKPQLISNSAH